MKTKIDVTTAVTLDEIRYQLIDSLTMKELISFVIDIGDNMSEQETYILELKKSIDRIVKEMENEN